MTVSVRFQDLTGRYVGSAAPIIETVERAFRHLETGLATSNGTIDVEFRFVNSDVTQLAVFSGGVPFYLETQGGIDIYDTEFNNEIKSGVDPNPSRPEAVINVNLDYFLDKLWLNPDSGSLVPLGKIDLFDIVMSGLVNRLGMVGWREWVSPYELPANYATPFDQLISVIEGKPYFMGPNAIAVYGGPVPLTVPEAPEVGTGPAYGLTNLGNSGGEGHNLISGIMGHIRDWSGGTAHPLSRLNAAILKDVGVPIDIAKFPLIGYDQGDAVNIVDVNRFYNKATGNHFFTASETERAAIVQNPDANPFLANMNAEGVAYKAFDRDTLSTIDLYRFYNSATGSHFFTADAFEYIRIKANPDNDPFLAAMIFEGTAYYVLGEQGEHSHPVWRFYNTGTGVHFYTASETEKEAIVINPMQDAYLSKLHYEGVAFWVPDQYWGL